MFRQLHIDSVQVAAGFLGAVVVAAVGVIAGLYLGVYGNLNWGVLVGDDGGAVGGIIGSSVGVVLGVALVGRRSSSGLAWFGAMIPAAIGMTVMLYSAVTGGTSAQSSLTITLIILVMSIGSTIGWNLKR